MLRPSDVEPILQVARSCSGPEEFALRILKVDLETLEPKPRYRVSRKADGTPVAVCSSETLDEQYSDQNDYDVTELPPGREQLQRYASLVASRERLMAQWRQWDEQSLIALRDVTELRDPMFVCVAKALRATRFLSSRSTPKGLFPEYAPGVGGQGIEFYTPSGESLH